MDANIFRRAYTKTGFESDGLINWWDYKLDLIYLTLAWMKLRQNLFLQTIEHVSIQETDFFGIYFFSHVVFSGFLKYQSKFNIICLCGSTYLYNVACRRCRSEVFC